jgi:hypothetical protein
MILEFPKTELKEIFNKRDEVLNKGLWFKELVPNTGGFGSLTKTARAELKCRRNDLMSIDIFGCWELQPYRHQDHLTHVGLIHRMPLAISSEHI